MQVGTERSEVLEEDFRESLCSRHCNYSVIKMRNVFGVEVCVFQSVGKQRLRDCEFVSALVYCGVEMTIRV